MPVVERILFVVTGVALLAGAAALFNYERTLIARTRAPVFELSAAHSIPVSLAEAERCAGKALANLLSPLPAAQWREERCR